MKIAVLSSHTPSLFWFRMDMMKSFRQRGHEVYALGNEPEEQWAAKFAENGIIYRQISVSRNGVNPMDDLKTLRSIKQTLQEIAPEKIFTYQAKTVIYGGIAAAMLGIKSFPLIAGMGSVFLKDDIKTRVIRKIMILEYKLGMRKASAVFFQNADDKQIFEKNGIVKKQPVVMIPGSGVNVKKFTALPLPEKPAFLCIGRLIRDKGIYEYLEACKRIKANHPDVRCMLVGPYDTNPSAIKPEELKPYLDAGIEYFGEQEDVRPYLAQCSVYVLPSYREGTPKTNLEAMACGRAIITTDAPGCKETVTDMENGRLIPVKDIDALTEKMEWAIANPETVAELGRNGREKAVSVFNVDIVNNKICDSMGL